MGREENVLIFQDTERLSKTNGESLWEEKKMY